MTQPSELNFSGKVKRKTLDTGVEVWTVQLEDGTEFTADNECDVRLKVRAYLIKCAGKTLGVDESTLTAKLTRTWNIRVMLDSSEESKSNDDDFVISLFD